MASVQKYGVFVALPGYNRHGKSRILQSLTDTVSALILFNLICRTFMNETGETETLL